MSQVRAMHDLCFAFSPPQNDLLQRMFLCLCARQGCYTVHPVQYDLLQNICCNSCLPRMATALQILRTLINNSQELLSPL